MGPVPSLIFAFALLAACIGLFVWISRRVRKGGGGAQVGVLGAIHDMLSSERRRAAETIVERSAGQPEEDEAASEE
jgi:hypothetical protein